MQCLLCQQSADSFELYGIPPRPGKCPHCGAKPRHRELAWFFRAHLMGRLGEGAKVLEVGPSKIQAEWFAREECIGKARYTAIDVRHLSHHDLLKPPHRFLEMDVTRLTFSDNSFDFILCNHVLPYIRSDYQGMSQIHRCLKSDGIAVMNVSLELPKTRKSSDMAQEEPDKYTEEYRQENGTEWVYGEDYFERLEAAGFFHHRLQLLPLAGETFAREQGFRPDGELILCFKFRDAMEKFLGGL